MKTKANVVIEHADGSIIGVAVFTGKNSLKEARKHFARLVLEDMTCEANDEALDQDVAEEAEVLSFNVKQATKSGNYTSGCGDIVLCRSN